MKVILSRKGFDSEYGGQASPILPDGTLLSLPIPQTEDTEKFSNLFFDGKNYLQIIKELNLKNNFNELTTAHLDPDIRKDCLHSRPVNWKPLFGQSGAAQGKLNNENLKYGDIFLFFGWFRQTEIFNNQLRYVRNAPNQHIIFGYFQIDEILTDRNNFPEYANYHSHFSNRERVNNCIYTSTNELTFERTKKGADTLKFSPKLVLTKNGMTKSKWHLPDFFKDLNMSYHSISSFKENYFQSVARGQEFVIQSDDRLTDWVKEIVCKP
jgi:hypothetical protein